MGLTISERLGQGEIQWKKDIVPSYTLTPEEIAGRTGGTIQLKDEAKILDTRILYPYNVELSMGDFDVILRDGRRPEHTFYIRTAGGVSMPLSLRETAALCEEASITYVSTLQTREIDDKMKHFVRWLRLSKAGYVTGYEDISSVSVWMRNAAYMAAMLPNKSTA